MAAATEHTHCVKQSQAEQERCTYCGGAWGKALATSFAKGGDHEANAATTSHTRACAIVATARVLGVAHKEAVPHQKGDSVNGAAHEGVDRHGHGGVGNQHLRHLQAEGGFHQVDAVLVELVRCELRELGASLGGLGVEPSSHLQGGRVEEWVGGGFSVCVWVGTLPEWAWLSVNEGVSVQRCP